MVDIEKILKEKLVINCQTEKEAIELLNAADDYGLSWCNEESYKEKTSYLKYEKETCYTIHDGVYGNISYQKSHGKSFTTFKKFMNESETSIDNYLEFLNSVEDNHLPFTSCKDK